MFVAGIIGSLVLLAFIVGTPWVIADHIRKRYTPSPSFGSKMVGAFVSGALMGLFAGFVPACIVYVVSQRGSVAAVVLAACALGGGYLWCRFEQRMRDRSRQPAKPYFRKLAQTPARISEPPAI